jgi:hypothetical protein
VVMGAAARTKQPLNCCNQSGGECTTDAIPLAATLLCGVMLLALTGRGGSGEMTCIS